MARILFLGKLADIAGGRTRELTLDANVRTIDDLIVAVSAQGNLLAEALNEKSVRFVINENFASRNSIISGGDEIAFLPPVSGG